MRVKRVKEMKKRKKLICLDLDNTIIKSDKAHIEAYNKAFVKNSMPTVKGSVLQKQFGRVGRVILKELYPKLSKQKINVILRDQHMFLIKETKKYARLIPGAKNALKKIKKHFRLALVTNCSTITMNALMQATKIDKNLFTVRIGQDQVLHPKPAPDEILKAEKLLHLGADYMVGDTPYDIIAGKKAKVRVIAVLTGNHSRKELQKQKPYKIIKSIKELPEVVI